MIVIEVSKISRPVPTLTHFHFGLILKDLKDSSLAEEEQDSLDQSLVRIYKLKGLATAAKFQILNSYF